MGRPSAKSRLLPHPCIGVTDDPRCQAQVCAAGALLNILGPVLEEQPLGAAQRRALGRLIRVVLVLSMVQSASAFDQHPPA